MLYDAFSGKKNNKVRQLMSTHRKCTIPDDSRLEGNSDVQANIKDTTRS